MPQPKDPPPKTPAFDHPWQAQAFALTVALAEAGHFTWSDWSQALGARLNSAEAAQDGSDYYDHWLANLTDLLAAQGHILPNAVTQTALAWQRAAAATPHGQPIQLENDPQS